MLYNEQVTVTIDAPQITDVIGRLFIMNVASGVNSIMKVAQEKAKQFAPAHIAKGINRDEAKLIKDFEGSDAVVARIFVSVDEIPDAGAWEYGSGIWAEEGNPKGVQPGKYPIRAVNAPNLHFWWENRNKWFVGRELPYGHPGIRPRSYLRKGLYEIIPLLWSNLMGVKNVV